VLASAAPPELAARGDKQSVVSTRGHRHDGLVQLRQGFHQARPRNTGFPPRARGEGDVAQAQLAVPARAD
jgi:hypothetical protein